MAIFLPQLPKAGITDMHHHTELKYLCFECESVAWWYSVYLTYVRPRSISQCYKINEPKLIQIYCIYFLN